MTKPFLLAFDFDNTIIDENSDVYITKLSPDEELPEEVVDRYSGNCWVDYMAAIFSYLHENGVSPDDIRNCMNEIPFTQGMKELLKYLLQHDLEAVIISDANSVFINQILRNVGLEKAISKVFTNPAEFDSKGCLRIQYYHTQDWCERSTRNLCKGHILQEYIRKRKEEGVTFQHIGYIGDGSFDLCPCLTLGPDDFAFPRVEYSLWKKLKKLQQSKDESDVKVMAKIIPWSNGLKILEKIKHFL